MANTTDELDFLSRVFKVLGDPTRLKLFRILLGGVHCNCELGKTAGLPNNLISHHLRVLSEAGLIVSTRKTDDARWIYYSVNHEKLVQIQAVLGAFLNIGSIPDREPECPPCKEKTQPRKGNRNE